MFKDGYGYGGHRFSLRSLIQEIRLNKQTNKQTLAYEKRGGEGEENKGWRRREVGTDPR